MSAARLSGAAAALGPRKVAKRALVTVPMHERVRIALQYLDILIERKEAPANAIHAAEHLRIALADAEATGSQP